MGNKWQEEEERIRAAAIAAAEGKARELGMTEVRGIVCGWMAGDGIVSYAASGGSVYLSIDRSI